MKKNQKMTIPKDGVSMKAKNIPRIAQPSKIRSETIIHKEISALIQKVRPYIQMHGGDVAFIGFKKGVVTLQISGSCTHCSLADLTYNKIMGSLLKEEIPEVQDIILIK